MTETGDFLTALAAPERRRLPALEDGGQSFGYAELERLGSALAARLRAAGLKSGDRVVVCLPNSAAHVVAVLALLRLGAVAVPVDPAAGRRRQAHILESVQPRLVLGDAGLTLNLEDGRTVLDGETVQERPLEPVRLSPQAPAFIRFSSGSTGQPKGIVLTRHHLSWMARQLTRVFGFDAGHRELLWAPLAYSGGWQRLAATLYAGGCVRFFRGPLSVGSLLEEVASRRISGFFTPPPLVHALLAAPAEETSRALSDLRNLEIGSAPLGAPALRQLLARLPRSRIFVHYGLTECSRATLLDARAHPAKLATVGRPLPQVAVRIVAADGRVLAAGETGMIQVRGPQQCQGYWNRPDLNRTSFTDGWIVTGDQGYLDEDGFLVYRGRDDDRINCGGYSFFPAEVEAELGAVAGIRQYMIAGVPDPRGVLGQVPWAFVIPEQDERQAARALLAQARRRLPAHQIPRWVVPLPELPLTPSGKPDRRRTVALYGPTRSDDGTN